MGRLQLRPVRKITNSGWSEVFIESDLILNLKKAAPTELTSFVYFIGYKQGGYSRAFLNVVICPTK